MEKIPMELDKVYVISNLGIHKMNAGEFCSWYENTSVDRGERALSFEVTTVFYNNIKFTGGEAYKYFDNSEVQ